MKDEEYAKLLFEASFKESDAFWKRNAAFLVTQAAFAGLYLKDLNPNLTSTSLFLAVVAGLLGIVLAVAHLAVLLASHHYNMVWVDRLRDFALKQAESGSSGKNWCHLHKSIKRSDNVRVGHATKWAIVLPFAFAGLWIASILYLVFHCYP